MPAPQTLPSRLIGALFVERGLVSESQIRVALEIQRETGQQLGQVLVERFGVSRKELASVVAEQWAKLGGSSGPEDTASWRRLGDIFVDRGFVTQEELDEALVRQRQTGERLGEALVGLGVISKFELAGALAEQMAALGEPDAEQGVTNGQPEATVHRLHARDQAEPETPVTNVIDLTPPTEWGAASVEPDAQAVETNDEPVAEQPVADEPVVEEGAALHTLLAYTEPAEPSQPAEVMLTELNEALAAPESTSETAAPETVAAEAVPVEEPQPVEVLPPGLSEAFGVEEPPAVGEPLETVAAEAAPVEEPEPVEVLPAGVSEAFGVEEPPAVGEPLETVAMEAVPVEEPQPGEVTLSEPAEVMLSELHETLAAEAEPVDEAAAAVEARAACLAFAPTSDGYRLVALAAQPEPGETIEIPDVGEYLVLRVGSSPIPGDECRCAYVEELVTPALVGAVAH